MAGLTPNTPNPTEIKLHQTSRVMEIAFDNGSAFRLPYEFLRVYSPSAEVRGHGPGQETLQLGKKDVEVVDLQPVGQYAVKLVFSDGHDTGIYSWDLLYDMGMHQDAMWMDYLGRVKSNCASRTAAAQGGMCGGIDTDDHHHGGGGSHGGGHGGCGCH
ncbi:MAG TPA: DUF971 domain-containing protein [Rhodocyclaceae bacterium]|nr:DUF971 domain-containing protein [Rhodocyclaceae bacterium]